MLAYVFPGQGSEKKGMGEGLFDTVEAFCAVEKEIDDILGYSLRKLCLEDPDGQIHETQFTQPALFVVNALHFLAKKAEGACADYMAGLSLGEYNALFAAGAFDLVAGVRLVQKRGALMAEAEGGGMAAVLGIAADQIQQVITDNQLTTLTIANYNSEKQSVLSGPKADIEQVAPLFKASGAKLYKPLTASGAFHTRYMEPAARQFETFLADFTFNRLSVPVVANVTGQVYGEDADPTAMIRELLVRQIYQPVRWLQSVQNLRQLGVTAFEELGPGMVLTKMIKQIK